MQKLHTLILDMKVQHILEMVTWHLVCHVALGVDKGKDYIAASLCARAAHDGTSGVTSSVMVCCRQRQGTSKEASTTVLCTSYHGMSASHKTDTDNLISAHGGQSACKIVGPAVFTIIPTPSFDSPVDLACTLIDPERTVQNGRLHLQRPKHYPKAQLQLFNCVVQVCNISVERAVASVLSTTPPTVQLCDRASTQEILVAVYQTPATSLRFPCLVVVCDCALASDRCASSHWHSSRSEQTVYG